MSPPSQSSETKFRGTGTAVSARAATGDTVLDGELKRRMRAGDAAALGELLRLHWSPLLAYINAIVGRSDDAEDVVQETFLRLWEHRADWNASGSVRSLLYRIGRNLALNEQRRSDVRFRLRRAVLFDEAERGNPTPVDVLERHELASALDQAIRLLPARRREVFELRSLHGLSVRETAEVMNISPQTVKNQMSSAAEELRHRLAHLL